MQKIIVSALTTLLATNSGLMSIYPFLNMSFVWHEVQFVTLNLVLYFCSTQGCSIFAWIYNHFQAKPAHLNIVLLFPRILALFPSVERLPHSKSL